MKRCSKCGTEKPPADFYGTRPQCKKCHREGVNRWKAANRDQHNARCNERNKERLRENPERERIIRRRLTKEWQGRQRAALAHRAAEWAAAHPALVALIAAELADSRRRKMAAAREREKLRLRGNAKAWATANPVRRAAYVAKWKGANPGRCLSHQGKRRAAKLACPTGEAEPVAAFYEHVRTAPRLRCYYCWKWTKPSERHVDHVIPIARGGGHVAGNLACACKRCNLTKHAKTPDAMGLLPF